ncbi:hypothetical protein BDD12DRAFT_874040 [Trichophaea hybrida]|nr:hypothetical protein BDD12DRAFT_874040 [Trichophaea hybrida]
MGKLNYTNRKISGVKLGSTVKKDILKHSQSASKSRSIRDLELNLQGKDLGDEGLEIVCDGLCQGLASGSLRLDELHLAENKITSRGLKFLGDVTRLASADLKDLDLRANELAIVTQEDAEDWENFLESFRDVTCLRRLDLSENPIGDRGFEVLWRVYSREDPIYIPKHLKSLHSDDSDAGYDTDDMGGDSDEMDSLFEQARSMNLHSSADSCSSTHTTPAKSDRDSLMSGRPSVRSLSNSRTSVAAEIHGLRSIPYMIFTKTSVTDSTALFLSYILPAHPTPERIMRFLPAPKPGAPTEILESYYASGCRGIIYRPNDKLSPLSKRVLDCAEALREGKPVTLIAPNITPYNKFNDSQFSPRKRRNSVTFILGGSSPTSSIPDLERARSKIQGAILKENGPHYISLWSSALKVLVVSREIFFDPNAGSYEGHHRSFGRHSNGNLMSSGFNRAPISPPTSPTRRFSTPASYLLESTPLNRMDDSHAFPPLHSPLIAKAVHSVANGVQGAVVKTERRLPGGLPESLWKNIIAMAVDPDGLLSSKQISNLADWARTRNTLEKERELSGKLKSLQIWRILESTECLAYDEGY